MILALAVGGAGGAGAISRYMIDRSVTAKVERRWPGEFPWGTWAVNVIGSLILGLVVGLVVFHQGAHAVGSENSGFGLVRVRIEAIVGTGYCGGLTTWSTATWETLLLARRDGFKPAGINVMGGLAASMVAGAIGLALAAL